MPPTGPPGSSFLHRATAAVARRVRSAAVLRSRARSTTSPAPLSATRAGSTHAVRAAALAVIAATAVGCAADQPPPIPEPTATAPVAPVAAVPPSPDRLAGILDRSVPPTGSGELDVVRGVSPAPARSRTIPVRVEVERGLRIDGDAFAAFVLATLNDRRGWGRDGNVGFARTDGDAPIRVVLASPATTDRLCAGLRTNGRLSCRSGPRAVLNHLRWVTGIPDYRTDLTGYRHYMVNHEVGHVLGHGHLSCPGPGQRAPVMQQQSLGLDGCRPNPWPHP